MRFAPALCVLMLPFMLNGTAMADSPLLLASAESGFTQSDGPDDKDATEDGNQPPLAPHMRHHAKTARAADGRPLLPERPKDFNPMLPPAGADSAAMQSGMTGDNGVSAMYLAQLGSYAVQLAGFLRWLVLLAGGIAILLLFQLFYLRRSTVLAFASLAMHKHTADQTLQNVSDLKNALAKDARAYLFLETVAGEFTEDRTGSYEVRVSLRNTGRTPAHAVAGWLAIYSDDVSHHRDNAALSQQLQERQGILPPGGGLFYAARTTLPKEESKAIIASERTLHVCGEVRYRDVFDAEHVTRFEALCTGDNLKSGSFHHTESGD